MVTELEADPSGVRRGVAEAVRSLTSVQARLDRIRVKPETKDAIRRGLADLNAAFRKAGQEAADALSAGLIDKREFARQAGEAAQIFNTSLARGMRNLERQGALTRSLDSALRRQMKDTGQKAGLALAEEILGNPAQLASRGRAAAKSIVEGLQQQFVMRAVDAREELFRGLIDKQEFQRRGAQSAHEFNQGILLGMADLAERGELTAKLHAKLVGELKQAGLSAGQQMAAGVQQGTGAVAATTASANRAMRGFSRESVLAFVSVGYALEGLISGAQRGEAALMRMARGGVAISGIFGPTGLVVGAVGATALAIVGVFTRARDEAKRMAEDFKKTLDSMIDARQLTELQLQLREIEIGKVSAGPGGGGGFRGSLRALETEARELEALIRRLAGLAPDAVLDFDHQLQVLRRSNPELHRTLKIYDELAKRVKTQRAAWQEVADAIDILINAPPLRGGKGGMMQVVTSTAAATQTFAEQMKLASDRVRVLLQLLTLARENGQTLPGLAEALSDAYDEATRALARHGNKLDDTRLQLLQIQKEIIAAFTIPAPTIRARGGLPAPPLRLPPAPPAVEQRITATLAAINRVREVSQAAGSALLGLRDLALSAGDAFREVGRQLVFDFSPFGLVLRAVEPALRALQPAIDALVVPLTIVAEVFAAAIIPVLKLLFPVFKFLGIVVTVLGEVIARVNAAIAEVVGNVVRAIGRFISKIPGLGGFGRSVERAGKALLTYAREQRQIAREMRDARREIRDLTWESATDRVAEMGETAAAVSEQLRNVPTGFRVALARFNATAPVVPTSGSAFAAPSPVGGGTVVMQFGDVIIEGAGDDPAGVYEKFLQAAREKSSATFGTSTRWPELT